MKSPSIMSDKAGFPQWEIIRGDALQLLRDYPAGSFDAVITDPPYASGGRAQAEKNKSTAQCQKNKPSGTCTLYSAKQNIRPSAKTQKGAAYPVAPTFAALF